MQNYYLKSSTVKTKEMGFLGPQPVCLNVIMKEEID
jgi:hypothetical protein